MASRPTPWIRFARLTEATSVRLLFFRKMDRKIPAAGYAFLRLFNPCYIILWSTWRDINCHNTAVSFLIANQLNIFTHPLSFPVTKNGKTAEFPNFLAAWTFHQFLHNQAQLLQDSKSILIWRTRDMFQYSLLSLFAFIASPHDWAIFVILFMLMLSFCFIYFIYAPLFPMGTPPRVIYNIFSVYIL